MNMKKLLLFSLLLTFVTTANAQGGRKEKIIDNGGSGVYKAEAIEEKTFKDAVIYKPADMKTASKAEGKLPILT